MTVRNFFRIFTGYINCSVVYFSVQLGRCVLLSLIALAVIYALRKTILKNAVFLKGMVWAIFLLLPFTGKLKLFYESTIMFKFFYCWHYVCCKFPFICYAYMLGVLVWGSWIFYKRRKLIREIVRMPMREAEGLKISVSDASATPFAIGLIHTRIVIPDVLLKTLEPEEIRTIILHEKNHIRLGHLLFYFLWDILRALLWVNPFLTLCIRDIKGDFEAVCDRITIQKSGRNAYGYGQLLLKTMRLLQPKDINVTAAFVGEKEYETVKRRFIKVADFRPYRKDALTMLYVFCVAALVGGYLCILHFSYPNYTNYVGLDIISDKDEFVTMNNMTLMAAVEIDENNVYVDMNALDRLFQEQGISVNNFFIRFGGYMKLPGFGGGGCAVYVNRNEGGTYKVLPYYNNDKELITVIYKYL